jgi:hypothetical protein
MPFRHSLTCWPLPRPLTCGHSGQQPSSPAASGSHCCAHSWFFGSSPAAGRRRCSHARMHSRMCPASFRRRRTTCTRQSPRGPCTHSPPSPSAKGRPATTATPPAATSLDDGILLGAPPPESRAPNGLRSSTLCRVVLGAFARLHAQTTSPQSCTVVWQRVPAHTPARHNQRRRRRGLPLALVTSAHATTAMLQDPAGTSAYALAAFALFFCFS